jgi:hypothetical protein
MGSGITPIIDVIVINPEITASHAKKTLCERHKKYALAKIPGITPKTPRARPAVVKPSPVGNISKYQ